MKKSLCAFWLLILLPFGLVQAAEFKLTGRTTWQLGQLMVNGIPFVIDKRGKHDKVRWEVDGRKFAYSCAKSPGYWRASENCRCAVRRVLRSAGVTI